MQSFFPHVSSNEELDLLVTTNMQLYAVHHPGKIQFDEFLDLVHTVNIWNALDIQCNEKNEDLMKAVKLQVFKFAENLRRRRNRTQTTTPVIRETMSVPLEETIPAALEVSVTDPAPAPVAPTGWFGTPASSPAPAENQM